MTPESSRRATRADVARLAGVSPAVVSFTLNGSRPVAPETAERVRAAIAELGYTPNAAARALTTGRSTMLGLVVHDITNPYYSSIAATVQEEADARGLGVIVMSTLGDSSRTLPLMRALDDRHVRGIIVTTALLGDDEQEAGRLQARVVQLSAGAGVPGAAVVRADMRSGADAAMRHLVDLGHARIAYLGGRDGFHARLGAWEASHRERGVEPGPCELVPFSRTAGDEGMRRILALEVPTAVLCASDMIAVGAMRALRDAGLRVPEDVSVVGFDDTYEARFAAPALTTVHLPIEEMARLAVAALDDDAPAIGDGAPRHPTHLVVRDSTAAPRALACCSGMRVPASASRG
ncbi:LacI family DNA-binding transcriptional regulator [Agrococcus jejuensis]|uniref:Transcriptional regulator, LacI family n=1 Tax=Agrococcus jejuensis TaxID=399736 RepID=A0A1G8DJF5_9MICO|nr:LacI family DNA-binding transcriptional regulator [Agrococcus jejuensis]SDH57796.1 transcriptional regulator, LacI family [Agrococcus jejuensis]